MSTRARSNIIILVIDDDVDLVETLTDSLELVGKFSVISANDGERGLERVYDAQPDCVIVDVRMPNLNGLQFVRAMRGDPTTAQIPIIILSALIQNQDELLGMFSGADVYLRKPVRMTDLLQAVTRSLQLSQTQRELRWRKFASHPLSGDTLESDADAAFEVDYGNH